MKKRILSMLLLVAMVVTALPLFALTVFATGTKAEEPTFTEEDYNDLYVQDDLFFAADFFNTKSGSSLSDYIWKKTGSPSLSATNGTVADGKLSIAAGVLTIKPAGTMTATDYNLTIEHVLDVRSLSSNSRTFYLRGGYLNAWNSTGLAAATENKGATFAFASYSAATGPSSWSNGNSWTQFTYSGFTRNFVPSGTTFAFRKGASTVSYSMNLADNVDLSLDEVNALRAAVAAGTKLPAFAMYNAGGEGFVMDVIDAPFYADTSCLIGYRLSRQKNGNSYEWLDENFAPYTGITTEILKGLTKENCTYKLYDTKAEADAAMADAKAAAPDKTFMVDQVYSIPLDETPYGVLPAFFSGAGWTDSIGGTATFTGDVYAIRYYSRALSETETLVNHVADLAKFFGLNIAAYRLLDGEGRAAVAGDMATYQLTSDAAAVADAFEEAVADAAAAQYEGVVDDTLLDLMLSYGLDPFLAVAMPRDVAVNTTALLASLVKDNTFDPALGATVGEAYAKAIELDAAAHAERADEDLDFYNALFVQEDLVFALDFYQFNEFWGNAIPALPTAPTETYKAIPGAKYYIVKNGTALEDVAFDSLAEVEAALKDTAKYPTSGNTYKFEIRYTQTDEELKALGTSRFTYADGKATGFNSKFINDANTWKTDVGNYLNGIAHKATRGLGYAHATMGSSYYGFTTTSSSGDGSHYDRPIFAVKNGYMEVYRFRGNSWIDTNTLTPAGLGTMQLVTAFQNGVDSAFGFYFRDVAFMSTNGGIANNQLVYSSIGNSYNTTRHYFSKVDTTRGIGDAFTLTWEQDRGTKTAADSAIENRLWVDSMSLTPTGPAVIADTDKVSQNMLGWTTNTVNYYAIRYYDSEFDDAKIARNHFADVAKRFKLNLFGMDTENAEQMAALYAAVADISLTGSTRTEAQLAVLSILGEGVNDYYADYKAALGSDYATVKAYHLDPEAYTALPYGLLFKTRTLLSELAATGTFDPELGETVPEAYKAAMTADAEAYAALANEGTTFYDELYAQDGYVFGLDFFTLGRPDVWGDAAPAIPFKDVDLSGVTIAEGEDGSSTTYNNNAGLKSALEQFKKDHNSFAEQFITERDVANLNFAHYVAGSTTYNLAKAVYQPDVGSIRFRNDAQGANGIQPYNFPSIATDNVSFQLVMAPNEGLSNAFFFFYNIRPVLDVNYNITGLSNGFTKTSHKSYAPIPKTSDAQMLTFTLENVVTSKSNVTYSIRLWNELLSETKGSCTGADTNTYIGWGNSTAMNLYAFRVYNAELTETEIKQNHFADVAKYFRLNLTGMDVNNVTQMTDLYNAVANISLTSSTRAEAQLAVMTYLRDAMVAAHDAAFATLRATYTGKEEQDFIDLAAASFLDAETVGKVLATGRDKTALYDAVTAEALFGTGSVAAAQAFFNEEAHDNHYYWSYTRLDPENETWTGYLKTLAQENLEAETLMALPAADRLAVAAAAPATQAALDAAVFAKLNYYSKYTEDDYKALYVEDGLFFAADFFRSNEYWGGSSYTATAGASYLSYAWRKNVGTSSALTVSKAVDVGGGKLGLTASTLTVKPGGSMTKNDTDLTVEYVMNAKSFGTGKSSLYLRDIYLDATAVTPQSADGSEGLTVTAKRLRWWDSGPHSWGEPGSGAGWYAGTFAAFGRVAVDWGTATDYTFKPGAQKFSFVMAFADYFDMTLAEKTALENEFKNGTDRAPAFAIYSPGEVTYKGEVPQNIVYHDESCFIGYRVLRKLDSESNYIKGIWVDENFEPYTDINSSSKAKPIFATLTADNCPYKLYATEQEAKDAAAAANAKNDAYTYTYDRFYSIAMDESPYGMQYDIVAASGWTDELGASNAFTGDVYAIRYYSRALTEAETLQNHFADLAKFFRLDIANYLAMNADEKAAVHTAMAKHQLTDDRFAVVATLLEASAAVYDTLAVTGDAATDAKLNAFAAATGLDISRLSKVSAGTALVDRIVALADTAYAFDTSVVNYRLEQEILDFWEVNKSSGIQIRIDNGYSGEEAGVRAIYNINEEELRTMIAKYGKNGSLTFGTRILVNGKKAATLSFTATVDGAGNLTYTGTNTVGTSVKPATMKRTADGLFYTYAVTYTDAQLLNQTLLNAEYTFVRFVEIGGEEISINHGNSVFGDSISAAEAYANYAIDYPEDPIVQKVMGAMDSIPTGDISSAILRESGELYVVYESGKLQNLGATGFAAREGYNESYVVDGLVEDGILTLTLADSKDINVANQILGTAAPIKVCLKSDGENLLWTPEGEENWQNLCTTDFILDGDLPLTLLADATDLGKQAAVTGNSVVFAVKGNNLRFRAREWKDGLDMCNDANYTRGGNAWADLKSIGNHAFNLTSMRVISHDEPIDSMVDGTVWKAIGDDCTPLNMNGTYIGANHGYNCIAKIPNAGKTEADIGSVWQTSDGQKYCLVRIADGFLWMCPFDDATMANGNFSKYCAKALIAQGDVLTHVSGATNTASITATAANPTGDMQFYVAINSVERRAFLDGIKEVDPTVDGVHEAEFVDFYESYRILYLPAVLQYLMDNAGKNTNQSHCSEDIADAYVTVYNTYRFHKNGSVVVYSDFAFEKDIPSLGMISAVQSGSFSGLPKEDGYNVHYVYLPGTTNFNVPTKQTGADEQITISKSYLADPNVPVSSYFQMIDAVGTKAMNLGYNTEYGYGVPEKRLPYLKGSMGFYFTSLKMYPHLFTSGSLQAGDHFDCISYRIPSEPVDPDFTVINWYWVGETIYLQLHTAKAIGERAVALPDYMVGMTATVIEDSTSFTVHSATIAEGGITVSSTDAGYAIIRLTPAN